MVEIAGRSEGGPQGQVETLTTVSLMCPPGIEGDRFPLTAGKRSPSIPGGIEEDRFPLTAGKRSPSIPPGHMRLTLERVPTEPEEPPSDLPAISSDRYTQDTKLVTLLYHAIARHLPDNADGSDSD